NSMFKREAKFIELLARDHDGNVGITPSSSLKCNQLPTNKDGFLIKTNDFVIQLFERLPPKSVYVDHNFTSDQLNQYNIFKESEPDEFLQIKYLKCPEKTDPRLAIPECHLESESFHSETINIYLYKTICAHPNILDEYHLGYLKTYYPGSQKFMHPSIPVDSQINLNPGQCLIRAVTFGVINPMIPGYWKCCRKQLNSSGCLDSIDLKDSTVAAMDLAQVKDVNTYMTCASIKLANSLVVQFAKTVVKKDAEIAKDPRSRKDVFF
ncbi:33484_t:CDS:2, partial [Racocetra persica]